MQPGTILLGLHTTVSKRLGLQACVAVHFLLQNVASKDKEGTLLERAKLTKAALQQLLLHMHR